MIKENKRHVTIHYDRPYDVLDFEKEPIPLHNYKIYSHEKETRKRGWYGPDNESFEETIEFGKSGNIELYDNHLLPKIEQLNNVYGSIDNLKDQNVLVRKRRRIKSGFGDSVDIHKINQGQADRAWDKTVREKIHSNKRFITLVIDICFHCGYKVGDTLWTAAACNKIAEDLVKNGISCKIISAASARGVFKNSNKSCSASFVIKDYDESINIPKLSALSHLGAFRSYGFLAFAKSQYFCHDHLGYPTGVERAMPDIFDYEKEDVVVVKSSTNVHECVKAVKWAEEQINKKGNQPFTRAAYR